MTYADINQFGTVLEFPIHHVVGEDYDVERLELFAFYELAKSLQALAVNGDGDIPAGQALWPLFRARTGLNSIVGGKPFQLNLSKATCAELLSVVDGMMADYLEEEVDGQRRLKFPDQNSQLIPAWRWTHLQSAVTTFETVLREELRDAETYHVPRRGIFFTPALVEKADETFPAEVRASIPQKTFDDWRSAGRCLAFNLLSAAGFHVARAVEGTMEAYYQFCSGKPEKTLVSWNEYVKGLEGLKKRDGLPSEKMIAEIKQMKDDYRNPIMHPRVVLSESDTRMLFCNGESLIIGMAQELTKARREEQPNALLSLVAPPANAS